MTRRLALLVSLLAAWPAVALAGDRPWTSDDILGLKVVSDPQVSPDGQLVAYVVESLNGGKDAYQTDVWLVPVAGGEAVPLTSAPGAVSDFEWSADGKTIAFIAREPKSDERRRREKEKDDAWTPSELLGWNRLWVIDVATRQPRQLTTGELHVTGLSLSPDGRSVVFAGQPTPLANGTFRSDLYTTPTAGGGGPVKPAARRNIPRLCYVA